MSDIEFTIDNDIAIPKREFNGTRATHESVYPLATMKRGQSFALPIQGTAGVKVKGKDGTETVLTAAEDAKRHAAQRQSYFSNLGKRLDIDIVTRYFPNGEEVNGADSGTPTLRVWHNGPRKPKAAKPSASAPKTASDDTSDADLDL